MKWIDPIYRPEDAATACPLSRSIALLLVLALMVRSHGRILYTDPHWVADGDQARYLAMATHPFSMDALVREPPFCWRILVPLIV